MTPGARLYGRTCYRMDPIDTESSEMMATISSASAPAGRFALYSFIGSADLAAAGLLPTGASERAAAERADLGPVARAVLEAGVAWESVHLLDDRGKPDLAGSYSAWLQARCGEAGIQAPPLELHDCRVESGDPTDFGGVYRACSLALERAAPPPAVGRAFLVSAGTPAMYSVLVLLSQTRRFAASLVQTSRQRGVEWVNLPIAIAHDLVGRAALRIEDEEREPPRLAPGFFAASRALRAELSLAQHLARTDLTMLILGETGTGKEEVAFHMHLWRVGADPANAAQVEKARASFISLNCAALPPDMIEAELFGHTRGAFTGAGDARRSPFEEAGEGTVFLDEIGELPLAAQAKLLRALDLKRVKPIGGNREQVFHARVLAATHRDLVELARAGQFREDMLYRLYEGGSIRLPPLRAREDRLELADALLASVSERYPDFVGRRLGESARMRILGYDWPGNVRELLYTLTRAAAQARAAEIDGDTIERCLLKRASAETALIDRALPLIGTTVDELADELLQHYYSRALVQFRTREEAARAIGLSRQTLDNRMKEGAISRGRKQGQAPVTSQAGRARARRDKR